MSESKKIDCFEIDQIWYYEDTTAALYNLRPFNPDREFVIDEGRVKTIWSSRDAVEDGRGPDQASIVFEIQEDDRKPAWWVHPFHTRDIGTILFRTPQELLEARAEMLENRILSLQAEVDQLLGLLEQVIDEL